MKECFADHVHPNEKAAARIARVIYRQLTGKEAPEHVSQPFPVIKASGRDSINILLPIRIVRRLLFAPNGRRQVIPGFGVLLFSVLLLR